MSLALSTTSTAPVVGGFAELAGLRVSLGIVFAAGLCVCFLALRLREKT